MPESLTGATPPESVEQKHVEGWYQWVRLSDVVEFEEYGWRVVGRLTRFHYDSWLMFRPEACSRSVPPSGQPQER